MRSYAKKIATLIFALVFVICQQLDLFAQCPISPSMGTPSAQWDKIFTQNGPGKGLEPADAPGWTGGDSTYSVLLPNGDSAFFFSDSYIGEWPARKGDGTVTVDKNGVRTTAINCGPPICDPEASSFIARNSVTVLSKDRKTLKTLTGAKDKDGFSSSFFEMNEPDRYYWLGDGTVVRTDKKGTKKVFIFLHKFDGKLGYHGSSVAQLNSATLAVEKIVELKNAPDPNTHWGSAVWLEGKYGNYTLYIYGKKSTDGKKQSYVARTDLARGFETLADTENWTVWNGREWIKGLGSEAPITPAADSISDEYSVNKFKVDGRDTYIMVGLDTTVPFGEWKEIVLYSSCSPQGPFTGKHKIYETPETNATTLPGFPASLKLSGRLVIYNPHIHGQFSGDGRLLVSYNLNRRHNSDSIYIDGYRPRFISIPIKGLK